MKRVIIRILIIVLFFCGLEAIQRVRWYYKSDGSTYWLKYGFVKKPKDYEKMIWRITGEKQQKEIKIFFKEFNGIKKHNPEYEKGQINSLGFRSHEFNPQKPEGTYRIICVGGSTTEGRGSDIDHTWPAQLEKKLGKGYEVINAGLSAAEMPYVINILEKELIYYKPDMVICYLVFNHIHKRRFQINVKPALSWRIKHWLSCKSVFVLTLREKLTSVFKLEGNIIGDIYIPAVNPRKLAEGFLNTPEIFEDYREFISEFIRICKENGVTPVLVSEAMILDGDSALLSEEMEAVYKKMYAIQSSLGVQFIDAATPMKEHKDLFTDGIHLHPEGNEALAEIIYEKIRL